jgi:2-keto-4-pentenoate hydratase/2-oxohepta-3-ene-1,7-dioic acid hydratase in catechol pathway
MKLRRVRVGSSAVLQAWNGRAWAALADALARLSPQPSEADAARWSTDLIAFLAAPANVRAAAMQAAAEMPVEVESAAVVLIPFEPRSYRDFMLFERHAVDAARGFVRVFWPRLLPLVRIYEICTRSTFPAFRPKPIWYREPIYYMGNHLAFITDGEAVTIPSYTHKLDYELEIGFVLAHGLLDASPEEAEAAIGGFVVFNDFSARDVQLQEMRSGFGPQKSKHFSSAISSVVVTADEVLPHLGSLQGSVRINGELVAEPAVVEPRWSLGEALAHVSRSERLYPGEFFGSGTLPGGSGIETGRLLSAGDLIEIGIDHIGSLTNRIVDRKEGRS